MGPNLYAQHALQSYGLVFRDGDFPGGQVVINLPANVTTEAGAPQLPARPRASAP